MPRFWIELAAKSCGPFKARTTSARAERDRAAAAFATVVRATGGRAAENAAGFTTAEVKNK